MNIRCPGPHVHVGGRAISWFHLTGLAGAGASISVFLIGAHIRSLAAWPLLPLSAMAIVIFLGIAMVTKVVTGEERLTYYHNELVILGGGALFLHAVHQPVLAYLDLVAVAISAFLVCGRVGCCLVGCCHGRPGHHGVVYGAAHVDAGFPASYAGVPLVPVQLLEAATAATIALPPASAAHSDSTRPCSAGSSGATSPTTPTGSGTLNAKYGWATWLTPPSTLASLSGHPA